VKIAFYYIANDSAILLGSNTDEDLFELRGNNVEAGTYRVIAKATDDSDAVSVSDTLTIIFTSCSGSGSISAYGYVNIPGSLLINLSSASSYPSRPDISTTFNKFEYGPDLGDNYGARLRGYICAPETGFYRFYLASADQSELWLSTDLNPANIHRIAYVEARTGFRSWFENPSQQSPPTFLVKGAKYYIESVHKAGTGHDHLSVAWRLPDDSLEAPIPGIRLSPLYQSGLAPESIALDFKKALNTFSEEQISDALKVSVSPNPSPGQFAITIKSKNSTPLDLTVYDILGRVVEKRSKITSNITVFLGTRLTPGMYFLEVTQGTSKQRIKIIKQ